MCDIYEDIRKKPKEKSICNTSILEQKILEQIEKIETIYKKEHKCNEE